MVNLAVLSSARWDEYWGNIHYLDRALVRLGHQVLHVDPPLSPLSVLRHPDRMSDLVGRRVRGADDGVTVWRPRVLPGQNSRAGQVVNSRLLRRGLSRLAAEPDVVITTALESRTLLRRLDRPSIYVCIDSFEDLPGANKPAVQIREQELCAQATVVAACSSLLQERFTARGFDAAFVPHGCDPMFLVTAEDAPVPPELHGCPSPRVAYLGSLNFRLDLSLLRATQRAVGDGTLVIIGGHFSSAGPRPSDDVADLLRRGAVLIGHRHPRELPAYLAHVDVGIVPYTDTAFNRSSYPLKIPQYLGAGLPVVSSPNGATAHLGTLVTEVRGGPEEFEESVRRAMAEDDETSRERRRSWARGRPWTLVAEELVGLLDSA